MLPYTLPPVHLALGCVNGCALYCVFEYDPRVPMVLQHKNGRSGDGSSFLASPRIL